MRSKKGKGCADCHSCNYEVAYYMVHDHVWHGIMGAEHLSKLCLGCLSKRLGRKLTRNDFNDAPCNLAILDVLNNVLA